MWRNSVIYVLIFCMYNDIFVTVVTKDNNVMSVTLSNKDEKFNVMLSGKLIEKSTRKCGIQYLKKTSAVLEPLHSCTEIIANAKDDEARMCVFQCQNLELKYEKGVYRTFKAIKLCQGRDEDAVKKCAVKKVFIFKDNYVKTSFGVINSNGDFEVSVRSMINKGFKSKLGKNEESTIPASDDFYSEKKISLKTQQGVSLYTIEFDNKSPAVYMDPNKPMQYVFIASGSKDSSHGKNLYKINIQNPYPSILCYFGIKSIHDVDFTSVCTNTNNYGPCIRPCYKATLMHQQKLNYAHIIIKPYSKSTSSDDFVQTVTFGGNQPTVSTKQALKATIDLSIINRNEDADTVPVKGASIDEIKLIKKHRVITTNGDDPSCGDDCKQFQTITITDLDPSTEYILKMKIIGLTTLDNANVNYYTRYFYFKTLGNTIVTSHSATVTKDSSDYTKINIDLPSSFRSSGPNNNCELFYAMTVSEYAKFPATCENSGAKTFCSQDCAERFSVVNLDPGSSYKIFARLDSYADVEMTVNTDSISKTITKSQNKGTKSVTVILSVDGSGSFGNVWNYILYEKTTKFILNDCSNSDCNPEVKSKVIVFSWNSLNRDTVYTLLIWNFGKTVPKTVDIEGEEELSNDLVAHYKEDKQKVSIFFHGSIFPKTGKCIVKASTNGLSAYENVCGQSSCEKDCNNLDAPFDISQVDRNVKKYIGVTYTVTVEIDAPASALPTSGVDTPIIAPKKVQKTIIKGIVYSYQINFLNEIKYEARHVNDKLSLGYKICSIDCDVYKDNQKVSPTKAQIPSAGNDCITASYSILFDQYIDDYWLDCKKFPDFHYYYNNTYVKSSAPAFNRFYYQLTVNEADFKLTVKLINDQPAEICVFQWIDATPTKPFSSFSNTCLNNGKCYYHPCNSITFTGIKAEIKAVKLRVIKLGLKPIRNYEDNVYIIKHGSDTQATTNNGKIEINISNNNKMDDENAHSSKPTISCRLRMWNINAPLDSEDSRSSINSPLCTFGRLQLTPANAEKTYDIEIKITGIENYPNLRKYFIHKITQSATLDIENSLITPGHTSLSLTPCSTTTNYKCAVYIKESSTEQGYFPAICEDDKLCFGKCDVQMAIIGLYPNTNYDIKIIPNGNFGEKILKKKTSGDDHTFKWSGKTSKSSLWIKLTSDLNDITNTNCYYHLTRHTGDKESPTEVMDTCVEDCIMDKKKKCDNLEFGATFYSKKYNYRLMVYVESKSNRVKIEIPKLYQVGIIEQKLAKHVDGDIDKFTISLSNFPVDDYKCIIKLTNFESPPAFKNPECGTKGGSTNSVCVRDCDEGDVEVSYINSKIARYVSICWGYDQKDAELCKEPTIFSIRMDYLQKHTYSVTHRDQKTVVTLKLNSETGWMLLADDKLDKYIDTNPIKMDNYAESQLVKSISLSLDRSLSVYNLESTAMWPNLIYYVNNSYLSKNIISTSHIVYSLEKDLTTQDILIKFSPGLYNDELCHIKVHNLNSQGIEDSSSVINNCGIEKDGCYQLCQNGKIALEGGVTNSIISVSVRRRFDPIAGHKEHFIVTETGVSLNSITDTGVTLNGLDVYKQIKTVNQDSLCTINIIEVHLLSEGHYRRAQCSSGSCNTNCENSYSIDALEPGTNYLISITVSNLIANYNNYNKKLFFRTKNGAVLTGLSKTPQIGYVNYELTLAHNEASLPICRLYIKKVSEGDSEYKAAICSETGVCVNSCHIFNVTNLNVGTEYSLRVEPSLGKAVIEEVFGTKMDILTMKYVYNDKNNLKLIGHFHPKTEESNCQFIFYEEILSKEHTPEYWCQDNECSSKGCILDFNDLSYKKNYTIHVEAHGRSRSTKFHIPYSKIEDHKDHLESKYDDIDNIDVFDHYKKMDKTVDDKPGARNTGSLYTNILYGIIPIVAVLVIILGVAIYKRNESSQALDI